jgi:outer membrane protein assembly factor BamB
VNVAIQSGGASGPWWDGQTGTWTAGFFDNAATVSSPDASSTTWSFSFPVPPTGGAFRILASAAQTNGIADVSDLSAEPGASNVSFDVRNAPGYPSVYAKGSPWVPPGGAVSIAGSGFQAGELVSFTLNGTQLGSATASSTGQVAPTRLSIPSTTAFGPTAVTATGQASGRVGTAPIYVSNAWTQQGFNATHSNAEPNDTVLLHEVAPGPPQFFSQAWDLPAGAAIHTSLTITHDVGYFGTEAGDLTAIDVRNSEPIWTTTESSPIDSTPAVTNTRVFFGTAGGSVVALSTSNGSQVWATPTSSGVESAPALAGTSLVVGSDDGTVYDLDQTTGHVLWHTQLAGSVTGSPAIDLGAGIVAVGDSSGAITALSATTGATLWQVTTGGPVTATPTIHKGVVYVGSGDGKAYALSETSGASVWTTDTGGAITAGGVLFVRNKTPEDYVVGSANGAISYLKLANGSPKVERVAGAVVGLASATGWVSATTNAGQVWGFKRFGDPVWEATSDEPFATAPVVLNGVVYTTDTDGNVDAYTVPGVPIP